MELSDEDLMAAFVGGDRSALRPLVERHHEPLLGFLYRMLDGDRPLAEDLVQETFVRVLRTRSYAPGRPFKPWLYAIATNVAIDQRRSVKAHPPAVNERGFRAEPYRGRGPEDSAIAHDELRTAIAALLRLPREYRAVLLLRFFHDLSLREIAEALAVPLGTVKSRLSVGSAMLRGSLAKANDRQ